MVDRVEPGWMRMVISGGVGVMGDRADVALGRRTEEDRRGEAQRTPGTSGFEDCARVENI